MTDTPAAIESLKPGEGSPDAPDSTGNEWSAWSMRRRLPSELAHKAALRWPGDVAAMVGIADPTLKRMRADGDHPRLYALGKALFTTHTDLSEWLLSHELAAGQLVRAPTIQRGARRPVGAVTRGALKARPAP